MKGGAGIALAAVVFVAGCGGTTTNDRLSKSEYEAKLQSALASAALPMHSTRDEQIDALSQAASRYRAIAAHLSGVRAPADIQALNDRLVAGAAKAAAALGGLVETLQGAPAAKRNRLLAEFDAAHIPGVDEFNRAATALAARGYRFSSSAGT